MKFKKWFETFLDEKGIGSSLYEIEHNGKIHFIPNEIIIEQIKNLSPEEQDKVKNILVMIDFKNGDVHHFLKHLAKGYIETNYKDEITVGA